MENLTEHWLHLSNNFPILFSFALNLTAAFCILIIGITLANIFKNRLKVTKLGELHVDATLKPVLASAVFYIIMSITLYAFLRKLGIDAASLLAIFGAAGLAIGLALKDTLSNIASGLMLLFLRPLRVGEYIETPGFNGTVLEVGLFATQVKTPEGIFVFIPNSAVWAQRLSNFNRHTERRLMIDIGVGYDSDLEKTKHILLDAMNSHSKTLQHPAPPEVHVMAFGDSAIQMSARCWLPADKWLFHSSDIRIAIKNALDENEIEIPFPQRVINQAK